MASIKGEKDLDPPPSPSPSEENKRRSAIQLSPSSKKFSILQHVDSKSKRDTLTKKKSTDAAPQIIMVEQFARNRATSEPPAPNAEATQSSTSGDKGMVDKERLFKQTITRIKANDAALRTVSFQGFNLRKRDMKVLSEALKVNTKVETLDFSCGGMKHPELCIPILASALTESKTIKNLDLSKNTIGPKALRVVEELIQSNLSIVNLNLGEEYQDSPAWSQIQVYLSSNRNYEKFLRGELLSLELVKRGLRDFTDPWIGEAYTRMNRLNLSHNQLVSLPEPFGLFVNLEILDVSSNALTSLPASIGSLTKLKQIIATQNKLTSLPDSLKFLHSMTSLDLSHNRLPELPSYLHTLKSLSFFRVMHNPIKGVPRDFISRGDTQLLSFLKEQLRGSSTCYRTKLMFVGEGKAGKTSLLNAMLKKKEKKKMIFGRKDEDEDSKPNIATDGIDIREWSVKTPLLKPDEKIDYSMWDFAGQEVYHYTHQFFLSHRALYIIVFDLLVALDPKDNNRSVNEESTKIEYWLQVIKAKAQSAPVLIVGTHLDDKSCTPLYLETVFNILKKKYSARFDNIVGYFAVSTKNLKGIEDLKVAVNKTALQCPYMPEDIPKPYLRLETEIYNLRSNPSKEPAIHFSEFKDLALQCGLEEENISAAATYFMDVGIIAYFKEIDKDLIITDPQWLTRVFSTLVTMKHNFVKKGIIPRETLPMIWKPPAYPEHLHNFIISLLERFDVIYRIQSDGLLFIPCLLADVPAPDIEAEHWISDKEYHKVEEPGRTTKRQLGRFYHFDFLPIGFFSRIIVRFLNGLDWQPLEYWKNGIILSKDTEKVLLRFIPEKHQFRMYVRGADPASQIAALVDNIGTFISDCLEVPVKMFIPCTHCIREGAEDPIVFNQRECETALVKGKGNVFCPRGCTSVSVHDMAPDVSMATFRGCQIPYSEVTILEEIGVGAFASVYKGIWKGEVVAVKRLEIKPVMINDLECRGDRDLLEQRKQQERILEVFSEFRQEVSLLSSLKHPNVVEMKGIVLEPFCIVMEYMGFGNLYDYVHNQANPLDWGMRLRIATGVASAIHFLHQDYRMIHRDLKSPNILLTKETTPNGDIIVAKVSDFGLSRKLLLSPELQNRVVDNPIWLAPEIIRNQKYTEKADVYSFGIIIYELLSRRVPFDETEFLWEVQEAIVEGKRPDIPNCPKLYGELIETCWAADPDARPNFDVILQKLGVLSSEFAESNAFVSMPGSETATPSSPLSTKSKKLGKTSSRRSSRHSKLLADNSEDLNAQLRRQRSMSMPPPFVPPEGAGQNSDPHRAITTPNLEGEEGSGSSPEVPRADREKRKKRSLKSKGDRETGSRSGSGSDRRHSAALNQNSPPNSLKPGSIDFPHGRQLTRVPRSDLSPRVVEALEVELNKHSGATSPLATISESEEEATTSEPTEAATLQKQTSVTTMPTPILMTPDVEDPPAQPVEKAEKEEALEALTEALGKAAEGQEDSESQPSPTPSKSSSATSLSIEDSEPDTDASKVTFTTDPNLTPSPGLTPRSEALVETQSQQEFLSAAGVLSPRSGSWAASKATTPHAGQYGSLRIKSLGRGVFIPLSGTLDDINSHKMPIEKIPSIGSERFEELTKMFKAKWKSSSTNSTPPMPGKGSRISPGGESEPVQRAEEPNGV